LKESKSPKNPKSCLSLNRSLKDFHSYRELQVSLHLFTFGLDGNSYAYSALSLAEKEEKIQVLGELLRNYQHLTSIDVSGNEIA
jgi:hypothetical protein